MLIKWGNMVYLDLGFSGHKAMVAIISFANKAGKGIPSREESRMSAHVLPRQNRETGGPTEEMV